MTRMFKTITRTWNPYTGCLFDCAYCWARQLVKERLQPQGKKYKDGFIPSFHSEELNRRFKPGDFVFVSDMGDISFATGEWRRIIIEKVAEFPDAKFLFQSKDPSILHSTLLRLPNIYVGTTIETNRDYGVTKAPPPFARYMHLWNVAHAHKFLSIEPVMDFDLETLVRWVRNIQPEIVEVGADNYSNNLPEPAWDKVEALLETLRKFVSSVVEKEGLERLKG